jgi:hypothetical protein
MAVWMIVPTDQYAKDMRHYTKKRPMELAAVLNNLDRYMAMLNAAKNAACIQAGYLHHEQAGVLAVDQKGGGKNLQETRLYTFADWEQKVLYLITIGNKDSQPNDVKLGRDFVSGLKAE